MCIPLQEISGTVTEATSSSAIAAEKKPEGVAPEKDTSDDFELPKKKKKRRPVSICSLCYPQNYQLLKYGV